MNFDDSVDSIKGIGVKTSSNLQKMGIFTVSDLLTHYPKSYAQYYEPVSMEDDTSEEIRGYLVSVSESAQLSRRGKMTVVTLKVKCANSQNVEIIWYRSTFVRNQLLCGNRYVLYGRILHKGKRRIMEHPDIFTEEQYAALMKTRQPVYALTEGITQKFLVKTIQLILQELSLEQEYLPAQLRKQYNLSEYNYAIRQIHFPDDEEAAKLARNRLAFDEFLGFVLSMKMLKKETVNQKNEYKINSFSLAEQFAALLPYKLTSAQQKVWQDIRNDMAGPHVMNRLVQGDVGSGKTMIAALAMIDAAASGYQSCMMAPTEVLARQHYENLQPLFEKVGLTTVLLTGSMTASAKRKVYTTMQNHEADVIIGTQALFQEKAVYSNLGLVVTDEQHRFGVRQRELLAQKSSGAMPHILVMSATPIPRTLAIILYSDLDLSVVDEKPANRLPIKNCVVGQSYRPKAYAFLEKQIRMGHQVYVICPMVEDSEYIEAENVQEYSEKLKAQFASDIQIAYLHGKMKAAEKDQIMRDFAEGKINILVSTTVVEVGVDVPNATVMMIENAERFGLAQLHQLRGRVGRGKDQSYCIFIHNKDEKQVTERLNIMNKTNDGFKIAAEDLKLRGPGEMFGVRQSGSLRFKIADVFADAVCLEAAGKAADELLADDPHLQKPEHEGICKLMACYGAFDAETMIL